MTALLVVFAVAVLLLVARGICRDIARTRRGHRGGWLR